MINEETYIPLDFNPNEFKIRRTSVDYGNLFLTRLTWSFIPVSGKWWQTSLLFTSQILTTFPALVIDFLLLAIDKIVIPTVVAVFKGFIDMVFKVFGKAFGWLILVGIIFSIYSIISSGQWRILYKIVVDFFSQYL